MSLTAISRILALVLALAGCTGQPAGSVHRVSDVESSGVLSGRVTKGPTSPMVQPGAVPDSGGSGVANAHIDIASQDGKPVTSAETDAQGVFRVTLPAGTYTVTMPSLYGAMFCKELPATVTIAPGAEKHLDIILDTGIR